MTPKVPINTTGTATAGIKVARQFCKNTYITTTTNTMASSSVFNTSSTEALTNGVLSWLVVARYPEGKFGSKALILAVTASATSKALAPSAKIMPKAAPFLPLSLVWMSALSAPSSMRATSFNCTIPPSGALLTMMSSNCATVRNLLRACMGTLSICASTAGSLPNCPADTWVFWLVMALLMSAGINWYCSSLYGSSHTRIA